MILKGNDLQDPDEELPLEPAAEESDEGPEAASDDGAPDGMSSEHDGSELDVEERAPPHRQLFDDDSEVADDVLARTLNSTIDSDGRCIEHFDINIIICLQCLVSTKKHLMC